MQDEAAVPDWAVPGSHAKQALKPVSFANSPAPQGEQTLDPLVLLKVPKPHAAHIEAAVVFAKLPGAHDSQEMAPFDAVDVPTAQGVHDAEAVPLKCPGAQSTHPVEPSAD